MKIEFQVDRLAIGHIMQQRGIKDYGISSERWNRLLKRDEVEHPYVQLIEEEIAVRLGVRSKYFDYDIPSFAEWVRKAQQREEAWKHYVQHTQEFKDISQFILENEGKIKTASL